MAHALPRRREPLLPSDVGPPDDRHHAFGDGGGAGGDRDPAPVARLVGVARGVVRRAVALAAGYDLELVVRARAGAENGQQGRQQRQVDDLAAGAVCVAVIQREHHRIGAADRGDPVREPERRQHRRAAGLTGLVSEAAHRLGQRPERAPLRIRPRLAEPSDAQHDEIRVDLEQALGPEAPLLHDAGAKVLDQHVRVFDEPLHDLPALGPAENQRRGALVARDDLPPQPVTVLAGPVRPRRIAARVLDLEHVGTVVPQQHGGDRRRVDGAQVQDADTAEGASCDNLLARRRRRRSGVGGGTHGHRRGFGAASGGGDSAVWQWGERRAVSVTFGGSMVLSVVAIRR